MDEGAPPPKTSGRGLNPLCGVSQPALKLLLIFLREDWRLLTMGEGAGAKEVDAAAAGMPS